jgi:hypothetical protein
MTRRQPIAFAIVASVVVLVAACGGGSSAPELTDPTAIVTAALKSTEAAKSVHVDATLDGSAPVSLPGLPSTGAPITLTDTSAAADVDLAGAAAHATFSVPAIFNLAGELIAVDGKGYLKTSIGGAQYDVIDLSTLPIDVTDVKGMTDDLGDFLLSGKVKLDKGPDVACGTAQCYDVTAHLTPDELGALLGDAGTNLPLDLKGAALDVSVRVSKDAPNHLVGLTIISTPGTGDPLKIDLTFSKWDEAVSIAPPPADQVKGG